VALMLVTGGAHAAGTARRQARAAADSGIDWVQVREKHLAGAALLGVCAEVQRAVQGSATRVLVNGRPDVAVAAGAAGVQLPEEGLPVRAVRAAFPHLVIGASCHTPAAAREAQESGADLVVFGPVFPTPGKEDRAAGLAGLGEVTSALRIPVYAIGGIDEGNAASALAAGARGLAAIRLFAEPAELPARVRRLRAAVPR
jgi:thiamine-phosphate pyrophosphorylase